MYIQTQLQTSKFENDELSELLSQITFQIHSFGLWEEDHDTQIRYTTDDIEIVYYKKGGSTTIIGNKEYHCPQGSFLVLEPYQVNISKNEGEEAYAYYYFHFDMEPLHLKPQFLSLLTKHGPLVYPNEIRGFSEMFERLVKEAKEKDIGYSSVITSALIRIIVFIMRAQLKHGKENAIITVHSPHVALVNDAIAYIQKHFHEPIRLYEMAQELGVSTSVLYKAFKNILDLSPGEYIQQQKIHYVQQRLLLNESLTYLAQDLGYSSAYHLSKAFKLQVGISPRAYKQRYQNLTKS